MVQTGSSRTTGRDGVNLARFVFEHHGCRFQEIDQQQDIGRDAFVDVADNAGIMSLCVMLQIKGELPVSLRNGAVRFANRSESGSVSHVFREQGIHIVADTVAEVVADDAYSIQPCD